MKRKILMGNMQETKLNDAEIISMSINKSPMGNDNGLKGRGLGGISIASPPLTSPSSSNIASYKRGGLENMKKDDAFLKTQNRFTKEGGLFLGRKKTIDFLTTFHISQSIMKAQKVKEKQKEGLPIHPNDLNNKGFDKANHEADKAHGVVYEQCDEFNPLTFQRQVQYIRASEDLVLNDTEIKNKFETSKKIIQELNAFVTRGGIVLKSKSQFDARTYLENMTYKYYGIDYLNTGRLRKIMNNNNNNTQNKSIDAQTSKPPYTPFKKNHHRFYYRSMGENPSVKKENLNMAQIRESDDINYIENFLPNDANGLTNINKNIENIKNTLLFQGGNNNSISHRRLAAKADVSIRQKSYDLLRLSKEFFNKTSKSSLSSPQVKNSPQVNQAAEEDKIMYSCPDEGSSCFMTQGNNEIGSYYRKSWYSKMNKQNDIVTNTTGFTAGSGIGGGIGGNGISLTATTMTTHEDLALSSNRKKSESIASAKGEKPSLSDGFSSSGGVSTTAGGGGGDGGLTTPLSIEKFPMLPTITTSPTNTSMGMSSPVSLSLKRLKKKGSKMVPAMGVSAAVTTMNTPKSWFGCSKADNNSHGGHSVHGSRSGVWLFGSPREPKESKGSKEVVRGSCSLIIEHLKQLNSNCEDLLKGKNSIKREVEETRKAMRITYSNLVGRFKTQKDKDMEILNNLNS